MYDLSTDQANKYKYLTKLLKGNVYLRKECPYCGHTLEWDDQIYENLVFEVSKNKVFPDKIMYGGHPELLIVSQKALMAFENEKVSGYTPFPITICEKGKELEVQYYVLRVEGKAEFNYMKMGCKPRFYCKVCNYAEVDRTNFERTYLKDGSWDGSDLFLGNMCTDRVLDIIKKYELTGFMAKDILYALNPHVDLSVYIRL